MDTQTRRAYLLARITSEVHALSKRADPSGDSIKTCLPHAAGGRANSSADNTKFLDMLKLSERNAKFFEAMLKEELQILPAMTRARGN